MKTTRYDRFKDLVDSRYSCRNYKPDIVDRDDILRIIETARMAPSACNRQPWEFIVVEDRDTRHRILAESRECFKVAPVLLVACGRHEEAWHRSSDNKDHTDIDVAIAVEHMCMAAASLDLATCWICSFDTEATREALSIPDGIEPIAILPIGHPADNEIVPQKKRKPISEIVKWEKY